MMLAVRNAAMHHQHEPRVIPPTVLHLRYFTGLRVLATAYFMVHAVGCVHQPTEQMPSPHKSPTLEKPSSPVSAPSRIEQPDRAKTVEKKPSTLKEKKSTASAEKKPGKKPEQPEEPDTDTFTPPPPLRPPIFGGAGG
jgi:hypothetical protein